MRDLFSGQAVAKSYMVCMAHCREIYEQITSTRALDYICKTVMCTRQKNYTQWSVEAEQYICTDLKHLFVHPNHY